jgi:outer membrane protein assembly factor BamE (lipoprotein component of BamABCDE complex)
MTNPTRIQIIAAAGLALAILLAAAWMIVAKWPDPTAALRNRLVGETARGVESLLGSPGYRERDDRIWHYGDDSRMRQFVGPSAGGKELLVEFDDSGAVSKVYLDD